MTDKVISLQAAIAAFVQGGDIVAIEDFTANISFVAGHEIIHQERRGL